MHWIKKSPKLATHYSDWHFIVETVYGLQQAAGLVIWLYCWDNNSLAQKGTELEPQAFIPPFPLNTFEVAKPFSQSPQSMWESKGSTLGKVWLGYHKAHRHTSDTVYKAKYMLLLSPENRKFKYDWENIPSVVFNEEKLHVMISLL